MLITELKPSDYDSWLPLWQANMEGMVSNAVTSQTWDRICDIGFPIGGLGARLGEGQPLCGICHFIVHPTTGNSKFVCYLQDLYVDPSARRRGVARRRARARRACGPAARDGRRRARRDGC